MFLTPNLWDELTCDDLGERAMALDWQPWEGEALVVAARQSAEELLQDTPERWRHSQGVAERAGVLAVTVSPHERPILVAAAWVHDIGYAPSVTETGFHPLDGGIFLLSEHWPSRLAALVAHHSGARFVAEVRGLQAHLSQFPYEGGPVADALTYADQTVGPNGHRMTVHERLADVAARHGPSSPNMRARSRREPWILAVAHRVEQRLRAAGGWPNPRNRPSNEANS